MRRKRKDPLRAFINFWGLGIPFALGMLAGTIITKNIDKNEDAIKLWERVEAVCNLSNSEPVLEFGVQNNNLLYRIECKEKDQAV